MTIPLTTSASMNGLTCAATAAACGPSGSRSGAVGVTGASAGPLHDATVARRASQTEPNRSIAALYIVSGVSALVWSPLGPPTVAVMCQHESIEGRREKWNRGIPAPVASVRRVAPAGLDSRAHPVQDDHLPGFDLRPRHRLRVHVRVLTCFSYVLS